MRLMFALALFMLPLTAHGEPVALSTGSLLIPDGYGPKDGWVDLVVHFHGSPERVRDCFSRSGRDAAIVVVAYSGLSGVYSKPFREDRRLFARILSDAKRHIAEHAGVPRVHIRRLVVSSFSAGFGAVREILRDPSYAAAITDLVLVDTLYAGYAKQEGRDVVDPADMAPFEPFAQRAARGETTIWLTYSGVVPPGYASTFETADYLARKVGARIESAHGVDAPGLNLIASADLGGFHIRGYAGSDGPAHMKHLFALDFFYARTSLPASP